MAFNNLLWGLLILTLIASSKGQAVNYSRPCEGYPHAEIYCYGDLLLTVQMSEPFEDQKTFVDHTLLFEPEVVLEDFNRLGIVGDNLTQPEKDKVHEFVHRNFIDFPEYDSWEPKDWQPNPAFLEDIADPSLREWASQLHTYWKALGRLMNEDVKNNASRHSAIYVSHPVIIPGGRFKEFYYWDSYWIQKGLIISNMTETVKGIIENFLERVDQAGFIPNGGRIYYQRSQPPLLGPMMESYFDATDDLEFIKANVHLLIKEYNFFMGNRSISFNFEGKSYKMARYNVERTDPRPESFKDDYDLVEELNISREEKDELYANLKTGAESGWDFSSRWFVMEEGESLIDGTRADTKTRNIIPVDLSSFLFWIAKILEKFCDRINDPDICSAEEYRQEKLRWINNIKEVHWDEEAGTWFDYDFVEGQKRKYFHPTNLAPLWVQGVDGDIEGYAKKAVNYLHVSGAANFVGGVPSSMLNTGEQWDFPNGWAPLNHLVVEGLEQSGEDSAKRLAFELAQKWVQSNHIGFLRHRVMYEKYDVSVLGERGGGGEYPTVEGFGWSNGVILDFFQKYGDRLEALPYNPPPDRNNQVRIAGLSQLISLCIIGSILHVS